MKHFFSLFRFEHIKKEVREVYFRFPIAFFTIIIFSLLLFFNLHIGVSSQYDGYILRSLFSLVIIFFLSTALTLVIERGELSSLKKNSVSALGILFGFLFFWSFDIDGQSYESMIYFIITLCGILSFLFFAPYLKELKKQEIPQGKYYQYFYKVSIVFLFSSILGGLLFGLGAIAIGTVTLLFDIQYGEIDKLYGDWAILSLAFFTPLFALSQFPNKDQKDDFHIHGFFAFLIKFVAIPFIFLYFAILYAYTVKVLLNFSDWPKGEVSWLVIGFSSFGYLTYIFSSYFDPKITAVNIFRRYFPFAVIPQVGMLFYAIYLRIAQYDLTTNRYFVVIFGICLLIISLYYIISKKKILAYIPLVIAFFTLLISIGPWSVYQLPEQRQLQRLETNLELAGILKENIIIISEDAMQIDPKLSGEIYNGISYVCDWNNCESIKKLFPIQYTEFLKKHREDFDTTKNQGITKKNSYDTQYWESLEYSDPSTWEIVSAITEKIKVQPYYENSLTENTSINFSKKYDDFLFPLQVGEYDTLIQIRGAKAGEQLIFNSTTFTMTYLEGETVLDTFSLKESITQLKEKYTQVYNLDIPLQEMTFSISGNNYEGILYLENITIKNPLYTGDISTIWENISGYALIRKK